MNRTIQSATVILFLAVCFLGPSIALAHQPQLVFLRQGDVQINNPETSWAFYDELKGAPRDYYLDFPAQGEPASGWELYINLLVPDPENITGRYSADVFDGSGKKIYSLDGSKFVWTEFYESFGRDYYLQGPVLDEKVPAGKYKIEVYSKDNLGKYVLAVGQTESYDIWSILNIYWQLPLLKVTFFKTSVLQFFLTPFGIGGIGAVGALLILIFFVYYLVGLIRTTIKHNQAKTLLLTSGGMLQMQDEIIKLLQKPAYDVTVGFITTASKPEENKDYLQRDLDIMKLIGFNVEEFDIEGKKEHAVEKFLELKDIIFVEGGNTFYLLKAMRACNFEKVLRKLLKKGIVYIGVSAGSVVAGKTIKTADSFGTGTRNHFGVRNLKGLGLVPFDIFPHFDKRPEMAEIIKQKIKNPRKRAKNLKILTDDQAILVQGKEVDLIGDGEAVIL